MPVPLTCPACRTVVSVPPGVAGTYACPRCRTPLRVAATLADDPRRGTPPGTTPGTLHDAATVIPPLETRPAPPATPSLGPVHSSGESTISTRAEIEAARADPQRVFGRFVLLEKVGEGGMGTVYRAWDERLKRVVAVKTLLAGADSASRIKRLQREAEAIARLRHPCIVAVHDVGEVQGKHYLAMDFIDGTTLENRLAPREGKGAARIPWTRALEAVRDVARAVHYAHEQGVIHRDLKPANIMLDAKDHPYVMDFGVARVTGESNTLTREGAAMGTPAYMPPEQADGASREIGPRSDVYSLGATLYHVLTGHPPFNAPTSMALMSAVLTKDPIPPGSLTRRAQGDLETICLKCLEKDPARRYPTAKALADDLDRYLNGEPISASPVRGLAKLWRQARRNKLAAATATLSLLATVGLGAGAVLYVRSEHEKLVSHARSEAQDARDRFEKARAEPRRPGLEAARDRNDALLALALKARGANERFASIAPSDPEAQKGAFESALALGRVALEAEQWSLAKAACEEALELHVADDRAKAALAEVDTARTAEKAKRREVVKATLDAARSGALGYDHDEALNTFVRLADAQTAELLSHELDQVSADLARTTREVYLQAVDPTPDEAAAGLTRLEGLEAALGRRNVIGEKLDKASQEILAMAEERLVARGARRGSGQALDFRATLAAAQARKLGPGELEVASISADALGRIGLESAVPALGRYVFADEDEYRASVAGLALCRLKGAAAEKVLHAAEDRFPTSGPFMTRLFKVLPRTSRAPEGEARTLDELLTRGANRLPNRDYEGAIADFTKAIELAPGNVTAWSNRGVAHLLALDYQPALADLGRAIELDPKYASAWQNRSVVQYDLGDYDAAIADASRAIELDPKAKRAWYNRGRARRMKGDVPNAIADLTRSLELDERDASTWSERAIARLDGNDLDGAFADASKAIELDPHSDGAFIARAMVETKQGDYTKAIADYGRQIELDPKNAVPWAGRGEAKVHAGDVEGAIADYTRALEMSPRHELWWHGRGFARFRTGDLEGSIQDFTKAIELEPGKAVNWKNRGAVKNAKGDQDGAIADYGRALELDPRDAATWDNRGLALRLKGNEEQAFADFSKAIELAPSFAAAYDHRGKSRALKGDRAGALADIGHALELDPRFAEAWDDHGHLLMDQGDTDGAIADFTHSLEIDPRSVGALVNRAWAKRTKGDNQGCIADCDRALAVNPAAAGAFMHRGEAHQNLKELDLAIADYSRASELAPGAALPFGMRGMARSLKGEKEGAVADLKKFLEIAPNAPQAATVKAKLAELEKP